MNFAKADDSDGDAGVQAPAKVEAPAASDDGVGDEGGRSSGGSSRSSSSSSSSRSSSSSSSSRSSGSSYSSPSRSSGSSYSSPSRSSSSSNSSPSRSSSYSAPSTPKSKPVDVGGGYTARTNPNGGVQYRDEKTGRDVSRKQFEAQTGKTARPSSDGKGIQFRDNNTGRDVSQRSVRADNNYSRPYVAPKNNPTGRSDRGAGYRQNTVHIDNSVHIYNTYRSGYGYGYYDPSGSWYNYHYMNRGGLYGYGYYDNYGLWNAVTDAIIINQMAQVLANPNPQVVYVQTGDGMNNVNTGQVIIDEPYDTTTTTTTTTTTPGVDDSGAPAPQTTTTTVQKTTSSNSAW
ncbi:MAG: hypothetical protein HY074_17185 [Deltaproteobacteria bacterium]|nr:hypothetical protein [Deltaproteobacteria bacterium]